MKTIILLISVLLTSPALARIGETPQECVARYGEPFHVDKERQWLFFKKAGLTIIAAFHDGKCALLNFFHTEKDVLNHPNPLTDAEIESLLDANNGGSKWLKPAKLSLSVEYESEDGVLSAVVEFGATSLIICTKAEAQRTAKEQADKEKAKLKGF